MSSLTLSQIHLARGSHADWGTEMCVMEAAAYIAGEPHSDHPACVCPTLATFLRAWNDDLPDDDRQKLELYVTRIIGTAGDGNAERRAWMALDWLTRTCTPAWLDLAGLSDHAAALRATPEITDDASLAAGAAVVDAAEDAAGDAVRDAARDAVRAAVRDAAAAAAGAAVRAAAGDAAWNAAGDPAGDAAWNTTGAAAWNAAWNAAGDAAWNVVRAAAGDAAGDAVRVAANRTLRPVVLQLQQSAFGLLDRMIDLPPVV